MKSNEEILSIVQQWQQRLNLAHYRVHILGTKPRLGNLLEIKINRKRRLANLRVSDKARGLSLEKLEPLLIHEVVHLLLDEMVEEYYLQVDSKSFPKLAERFDLALEKTVEHTAHALYKMKNSPS